MRYTQTLKEIRDSHYDYQRKDNMEKFGIDVDDFKSNPYTFFKWRYYIETSSLLLYFLIRSNIKPNQISLFYGFLGILTLVLLALPQDNYLLIYIGLSIAFTKSTFDFCDGYIARLKNQKSLTGFILDEYGAHLNAICFQSGIAFYLANSNQGNIFYYMAFLIPFFYATKLKTYAYSCLANEIIENKDKLDMKNYSNIDSEISQENHSLKTDQLKYKKIYTFFNSILDDRARSVDTIILFFLIEITLEIYLVKFILLFLVIKHLVNFIINLFIVSDKNWLNKKIRKIDK